MTAKQHQKLNDEKQRRMCLPHIHFGLFSPWMFTTLVCVLQKSAWRGVGALLGPCLPCVFTASQFTWGGQRCQAPAELLEQSVDFVLTVVCLKPGEPQEQKQKAQHGLMSWMLAEWRPLAWLQDGWGARGGASRPRPRTLQEAGGWESPGSRLRMLCALQRGRPGPLSLCRRLQPSVTLPSG